MALADVFAALAFIANIVYAAGSVKVAMGLVKAWAWWCFTVNSIMTVFITGRIVYVIPRLSVFHDRADPDAQRHLHPQPGVGNTWLTVSHVRPRGYRIVHLLVAWLRVLRHMELFQLRPPRACSGE
jgi:hypothetical protein